MFAVQVDGSPFRRKGKARVGSEQWMPAIERCFLTSSFFGNCFFKAMRQIPAENHGGDGQDVKRLTQSLTDFRRRCVRRRVFEILNSKSGHSGGKTSRTVKSTQNKPSVFGTLSKIDCPMSLGGSPRFCHQTLSAG